MKRILPVLMTVTLSACSPEVTVQVDPNDQCAYFFGDGAKSTGDGDRLCCEKDNLKYCKGEGVVDSPTVTPQDPKPIECIDDARIVVENNGNRLECCHTDEKDVLKCETVESPEPPKPECKDGFDYDEKTNECVQQCENENCESKEPGCSEGFDYDEETNKCVPRCEDENCESKEPDCKDQCVDSSGQCVPCCDFEEFPCGCDQKYTLEHVDIDGKSYLRYCNAVDTETNYCPDGQGNMIAHNRVCGCAFQDVTIGDKTFCLLDDLLYTSDTYELVDPMSRPNTFIVRNQDDWNELSDKCLESDIHEVIIEGEVDLNNDRKNLPEACVNGRITSISGADEHAILAFNDGIHNYILAEKITNIDIRNLTITFDNAQDVNGVLADEAILVNLDNVSIKGNINQNAGVDRLGGILGMLEYGNLKDVFFEGNIEFKAEKTLDDKNQMNRHAGFGGIVGYARDVKFENVGCSGEMRISADGKNGGIGGIVGYGEYVEINDVNISKTNENSDQARVLNIYGTNRSYGVGGVIGYAKESRLDGGQVTVGTIDGNTNIGGIAGYMSNSYINGINVMEASVLSGTSYVGGVAGYMEEGEISSCTVTINRIGDEVIESRSGTGNYLGGVIGGLFGGKLSSSIVVVNEIEGYSYLGGLIGQMQSGGVSDTNVSLSKIHGKHYIGGAVGSTVGQVSIDKVNIKATSDISGAIKADLCAAGGLIGIMGRRDSDGYESYIGESQVRLKSVSGKSLVGGFIGISFGANSISGNYSRIDKIDAEDGENPCSSVGSIDMKDDNNMTGTGGFIGEIYQNKTHEMKLDSNHAEVKEISVTNNSLSSNVGGMIGRIKQNDAGAKLEITNSSSIAGKLSGFIRMGGGFGSIVTNGNVAVSNIYVSSDMNKIATGWGHEDCRSGNCASGFIGFLDTREGYFGVDKFFAHGKSKNMDRVVLGSYKILNNLKIDGYHYFTNNDRYDDKINGNVSGKSITKVNGGIWEVINNLNSEHEYWKSVCVRFNNSERDVPVLLSMLDRLEILHLDNGCYQFN